MYGWDNHEVTLYTPKGAVSEGTGVYDPNFVQQENVFQVMSLTFEAETKAGTARPVTGRKIRRVISNILHSFILRGKWTAKADTPTISRP